MVLGVLGFERDGKNWCGTVVFATSECVNELLTQPDDGEDEEEVVEDAEERELAREPEPFGELKKYQIDNCRWKRCSQ